MYRENETIIFHSFQYYTALFLYAKSLGWRLWRVNSMLLD